MNITQKPTITNLLCPYCKMQLESRSNSSAPFTIMKCGCDEYPIVNGVAFVKKDDALTNKHIINAIRKKKFNQAVWISLSGCSRTTRWVVFFTYLVFHKFSLLIPLQQFLTLLKSVGREKSWWTYLLERHQKPDIPIASQMLQQTNKKGDVLLDIGCGIGYLLPKLKNIYKDKPFSYIGIDKSFVSLLIARMYFAKEFQTLICANIEAGLPLKTTLATHVLFIDCFAWIYNKGQVLSEVKQVLKKRGRLHIINLFAETAASRWWGYGIHPQQLVILLKQNFTSIRFFDHYSKQRNLLPIKEIISSYSVSAAKK